MTDQPTFVTPHPSTDVSKADVLEAARVHAASLHPTGGTYYASPRSIAEMEALKAGERAGFTEGVSWLFDLIFGSPLAPHEVARAEAATRSPRNTRVAVADVIADHQPGSGGARSSGGARLWGDGCTCGLVRFWTLGHVAEELERAGLTSYVVPNDTGAHR